jgi:hypothetical protein
MKKLFLVGVAMLMLFTVSTAQTKLSVLKSNNPTTFVAPSVSYSNGAIAYNLEAGICYPKTWLSLSGTYTPVPQETSIGLNLYNKLYTEKKLSLWTYNSAKFVLDTRYMYYEPGLSLTYDVTPNFTPQFTATVPVVPHTKLSYTLGVMYNF